MVELPSEFVIKNTLFVGTVYKLEAPELIGTKQPHYFIVVAIDGTDNFLVLCTTQFAKKKEHFDHCNLDYSGLVPIKPDSSNGLTDERWVNCNDYYPITKSTLVNKLENGILNYTGKISLNHYLQIKTGILESHINDLPEYLLIHPED